MEKAIAMNDEEYRGVPEEWKETEAYKSIIDGMNEMKARAKAFREGMKDQITKNQLRSKKSLMK